MIMVYNDYNNISDNNDNNKMLKIEANIQSAINT